MLPRARLSKKGVLGCLIVVVGCGTETTPSGNLVFQTRDSAGIEIAESSGFPSPEDRWVVETEPSVSIGGASPDPPAMFSIVPQASRLGDGRIVVLESETSELRFFDAKGEHLKTAGGKGEGPGEFAHASTFVRLAGDTLLVDAGDRHILFTPHGEYAGERRIDVMRYYSGKRAAGCPKALFSDGSFMVCEVVPSEEGGRWRSRPVARIVRVAADETEEWTLGLFVGTDEEHVFRQRSWIAWGGSPPVVAIINNPVYSIEVWRPDGRLGRLIRRLDGRRPPTDREIEEGVEEWKRFSSDDVRIRALMGLDDTPSPLPEVPDSMPVAFGITVGVHGDVWVRRATAPGSRHESIFDAFDRQGRFRGEVRFEGYFWLYEVGEDYLLTTRRDEWNVPHVQLHRLSRGETATAQ